MIIGGFPMVVKRNYCRVLDTRLARAVEQLGQAVEEALQRLLAKFAPRGEAELVRELTFHYPIQVIAKILGVPVEDYRTFARLSIELISIAVDFDRGMKASRDLREYLASIVAARRVEPQDDLISMLVGADINGQPLPDDEIYGFLRLLLPAGAETTQRLLGTLLLALLENPEQLEAVKADPKGFVKVPVSYGEPRRRGVRRPRAFRHLPRRPAAPRFRRRTAPVPRRAPRAPGNDGRDERAA